MRSGILAVVMLVAVGCSGDDGPTGTPVETPTTSHSPTTTTTGPRSQQLLGTSDVVGALEEAEIPIVESVTFTSSTDPNELLGRPGQYVGKAAWHDRRVECFAEAPDDINWDCGGDVEVFEDSSNLDDRYQYLSGFAEEPPLGGFYMWRFHNVIVRVTFSIPPEQLPDYEEAFEALAGGDPVERFGN